MPTKISGKASSITISGTSLFITKVTPKVTRDCSDTTDNSNYDAASDMLQGTQIPVKVGMELSVEGWFYVGQTDTALMNLAYSGASAVPVVLKGSTSYIVGHGAFDLTDFEAGIPVDETCTYSATLKQNGVFTPGS